MSETRLKQLLDDSAVLHFELCLEVAWKSARAYALTQGLQPAGPRDSLSALITLGVHADEQVLAHMLRARNDAVYIYRMALAAALRKQLPGFAKELAGIYRELSARVRGAS